MKFFILAGIISLILIARSRAEANETAEHHSKNIFSLVSSHKLNSTDQLINATQHIADELFHEEITRILGESEHILDRILVPSAVFENHTILHDPVQVNSTLQRIINKRQASPLVPQSPLQVQAVVQLASQSSPTARAIDAASTIALKVTHKLLTKEELDAKFDFDALNLLGNVKAPNDLCPFRLNTACNPSDRFSQIDGSCNNVQNPWFGKSETPYKRYMTPSYDDQLSLPRTRSVNGGPLPNPRTISRALSVDNAQFDETFTHMVAAFGQFLAHDVTSAAVSSGKCKIQIFRTII
jgi:hypothetical protein